MATTKMHPNAIPSLAASCNGGDDGAGVVYELKEEYSIDLLNKLLGFVNLLGLNVLKAKNKDDE